jgi:hypothetical protein
LLVFNVSVDLQEFFSAFWAVVGSIDHLFGVFGQDFDAAAWDFVLFLV